MAQIRSYTYEAATRQERQRRQERTKSRSVPASIVREIMLINESGVCEALRRAALTLAHRFHQAKLAAVIFHCFTGGSSIEQSRSRCPLRHRRRRRRRTLTSRAVRSNSKAMTARRIRKSKHPSQSLSDKAYSKLIPAFFSPPFTWSLLLGRRKSSRRYLKIRSTPLRPHPHPAPCPVRKRRPTKFKMNMHARKRTAARSSLEVER